MSEPSIAERVAAIQKLAVPDLVERYAALFGQPPHCRNRTWLWRNVAWKLQELHYGGLPPDARARLEQIIDEHIRPMVAERKVHGRVATPRELSPGTVLTREWHGRQARCEVTDAGFVVAGIPYGSLSAAANAVTGQRWNGRLFWGLTKRTAKEPAA
jgi:hypothetical protein